MLKTIILNVDNSINWKQSIVDGLIQFIFTVAIAYILDKHRQIKIDDKELAANLHDDLEKHFLELKEHYTEIVEFLVFLSGNALEIDRGTYEFDRIKLDAETFHNFLTKNSLLSILKIKIESKLNILKDKKLINNDIVNSYLYFLQFSQDLHAFLISNWIPNTMKNYSFFTKMDDIDSFKGDYAQHFSDKITEVMDFEKNNNPETIYELLVKSKYSYSL